jgi:hypothetical protein
MWVIFFIFFLILILDDDDDEETTPPPAAQQQVEEGMVQGVVHELIPTAEGTTLVMFDQGEWYEELHLGDHQLHIGEWNQLRVNHEGYVEEVWYGENALEQGTSQ